VAGRRLVGMQIMGVEASGSDPIPALVPPLCARGLVLRMSPKVLPTSIVLTWRLGHAKKIQMPFAVQYGLTRASLLRLAVIVLRPA